MGYFKYRNFHENHKLLQSTNIQKLLACYINKLI